VPVGLRLFLPDEWVGDAERRARAGIPDTEATARSKGEIALTELDRVRAPGVRFGTVLADAGYGASAAFRHGLDERGLTWAVGIARNQKVYDVDVPLAPPPARARKPVPDQAARPAEDVLGILPWRRVSWRDGTKGRRAARFAASRIRVGDGAVFGNNRHLPGREAWLLSEWRITSVKVVEKGWRFEAAI
jgi:SRSO17 transposase